MVLLRLLHYKTRSFPFKTWSCPDFQGLSRDSFGQSLFQVVPGLDGYHPPHRLLLRDTGQEEGDTGQVSRPGQSCYSQRSC